jgi:hypothetical protein
MSKELNVPDRGPRREITVEEASKCPKCNQTGKLGNVEPSFTDDYGKRWDVVIYSCTNEQCNWFETGWPVSSDDRGVVFQREQGTRGQDKTFEPMSSDALAYGRRVLEDAINDDAESVKNNPANKQD